MKVLIVEDEHRIAASIKTGLEQEKFTTDVAYTGTDGYDLASTGDYDLIILDLMLPGMDGLSVCKQLRTDKIHTPVLILTAKSQIQDKVTGLDTGADDYLTNPFSFEELLARCRALTRRPQNSLNQLLVVDDLTLDTSQFTVTRNHTSVSLSSKEFSLLEYLLRHSHQILSKDQIITHVWSYESDILPNTVEVYIRNLRRKIDLPFRPRPELIHTVRGFGYKIGD
ncbi:MAG: response regulator transcription factor [Candidatus Shapirobacteria bacterium]|nr:response regulator transcription factor [Candidatus Shapirobacteria bacterium]